MAKYTITHACGHDETHDIIGNSRVRENRQTWLASCVCSACYRERKLQEREAALAKARAEWAEVGLPELTGSEKQVDWADQIRARVQKELFAEFAAGGFGYALLSPLAEELKADLERQKQLAQRLRENEALTRAVTEALQPFLWEALGAHPDAKWWIDNRDALTSLDGHRMVVTLEIARRAYAAMVRIIEGEEATAALEAVQREAQERQAAAEAEAEAERRLRAEAEAEATIRPEQCSKPFPAEINPESGMVWVAYPQYDESLLTVVHRFDSKWTGVRHRITTHRPQDVAVELAHRLLAAGFPVRLWDPELRRRAVAGDFRPYTGRQIVRLTKSDCFGITWSSKDRDWYSEAKKLPGARWSSPYMRVPRRAWQYVLDFAETNGFELSPGAQALIDEERALEEAILPEPIGPTPNVELPTPGRPKLEPETAPEIPAHLLDDDE